MKKSRWLLQALILSLGLNICLIGIFFYFMIRDNPLQFAYPTPKEVVEEKEPPPFFSQMTSFTFEQLSELLEDDRAVKQGYRVRDFALGALVTFFDFDIQKAVGRGRLSRRKWIFDDSSLFLFPGLTDEDFQAVQYFAENERWPLTTKGLFQRIQKGENDIALLSHFCHTTEFISLEMLFRRTALPIQKGTLLGLLIEGGWELFSDFIQQQEQTCDFSDQRRQNLLLEYIASGSKRAAYLLLMTDFEFATTQLDDQDVCRIIDLLTDKTQEALAYIERMTNSHHIICEQAKKRMKEHVGEEVAGRFTPRPGIGELRPKFRDQPPASPEPTVHIIQPGESLWLIAKKYGVPIEKLMEVNCLQSSTIRPGKMLKIP